MNPWPIVAALVLALTVGNGIFAKLWLGARDGRTKAETELSQSQAVAKQCSDGVKAMEDTARARARLAEDARKAAADAARKHDTRAQQILSSPPAVPGDSCASADAAVNDWLGKKGKP